MINAGGQGNADSPNLIMTHNAHVLNKPAYVYKYCINLKRFKIGIQYLAL